MKKIQYFCDICKRKSIDKNNLEYFKITEIESTMLYPYKEKEFQHVCFVCLGKIHEFIEKMIFEGEKSKLLPTDDSDLGI